MGERIPIALGIIGDPSIIPDLLNFLKQDRVSIRVRGLVAIALGMIGDRSVVPNLLHLLQDVHLNFHLREYVAIALGMIGDHSAVSDIRRLLEQVSNPYKYTISYEHIDITLSLVMLGDLSVIHDLIYLLSKENPTTYNRYTAFRTGRITDALSTPTSMRIASILSALVNDTEMIRYLASFLHSSGVTDDIYNTLWKICQRMKLRIYITNEQAKPHIEIVPMEDILS